MADRIALCEQVLENLLQQYADIANKTKEEKAELYEQSSNIINVVKEVGSLETVKTQRVAVIAKLVDQDVISQKEASKMILGNDNGKEILLPRLSH